MIAAIAASVSAAVCSGAAAALQQSAAQRVSGRKVLHAALLVDLAHRPRWLAGLTAAAGGFLLQGLALHLGSLALVQPLILLDIVVTLAIAARFGRRPVSLRHWSSGLLIAGSVGVLLGVGQPHGGRPDLPAATFAVLAGVVVVGAATCVFAARRAGRLTRAVLFATVAGLLFGLLAVVLDSVTYLLARRGLVGVLGSWQPYLLVAVGSAGEIFAQSAYQAGPLTASSPVINTVEPGSAIAIGVLVFGEHINHTPAALAIQAVATLGVAAGVFGLSHASVLPSDQGLASAWQMMN